MVRSANRVPVLTTKAPRLVTIDNLLWQSELFAAKREALLHIEIGHLSTKLFPYYEDAGEFRVWVDSHLVRMMVS